MKLTLTVCAFTTITWSMAAVADFATPSKCPADDSARLWVNDADVLYRQQLISGETDAPPPRARPRLQASRGRNEEWLPPGVTGDLAVRTLIRTCGGVSVTITSFGGGDWGRRLDSLCDEVTKAEDPAVQAIE
ncbi:MAG: hypothetical protein ACE5G3_07280 [Gammaproteobacteria bacterium]